MKIHLSIQSPTNKSKFLTLTKKTLIGRGADCDLKLKSELVSRHHCQILLTDSVALINDLGSANGTFIDGQKLTPHRDTKLAPGCLLSIADINFQVNYDTQNFLDAGSTINLTGIEALLPPNAHNFNSENDHEIKIPTDSSPSKDKAKPEENKPSETITIDDYAPNKNTKPNKQAVQYPEIEIPDKKDKD